MSELNRSSLEEEFDIEPEEVSIENFRDVLDKVKQVEDPNQVLSATIEKAGTFLDMIEREAANGNMSARMLEVGSQIMNTLITAANSVYDTQYRDKDNELKEKRIIQRDRELDQKDKELEIKQWYYNQLKEGDNKKGNVNVLVTDRESVLKALQKPAEKSIEESSEQ